ncbi:MAG: hypothetical protein ACO1OQ_01800 [Rufibacter sp.]
MINNLYHPPSEPITLDNLILAFRLNRMGHSPEFIADFVTGSWSPGPEATNTIDQTCVSLQLKPRESDGCRIDRKTWCVG